MGAKWKDYPQTAAAAERDHSWGLTVMETVARKSGNPTRGRTKVYARMKSRTWRRIGMLVALCSAATLTQAQTCPTPPGKDVLLFVDNSGSISNNEFDAAQQAIAGIASSVLSRPGYRLAVVNWACMDGRRAQRDGCRLDLATGSAIPGGWSSNPADFAYAGNNSTRNKVCRSFGSAGDDNFTSRSNCGDGDFTHYIMDDYAQHALKVLEGVLYSGAGTGGNDSYNRSTVGPSAPRQQLLLIHMTDAYPEKYWDEGSSIREMPSNETGLGFYHYSNRFKNVRNAIIVGVGIDLTEERTENRRQLAALSSKGGAATEYDTAHQTATSTQAFDVGAPRLASFSENFNATTILSAANTVLNSTVPACVILRKQSVSGTESFDFTGGTNGLPASLTLSTAGANPAIADGVHLSQFNTPTSITETIPAGWALSSVGCTNAANTAVAVTSNLSTGQLTIPAGAIVSGAQLTCTFTNTRRPRLTIRKTSVGGTGSFTFSGSNGIANQTIATTTAGTPVAGVVQTLTTAGVQTTITEGTPPTGFALTDIACTGLPNGGTATTNLATRTVTLNAAATVATANVTCTFTNARTAIRLQKALPNGRAVAADQFTLSIAGTGAPGSQQTTGSGTTANGTVTHAAATPASVYTLSETGAAGASLGNYATTYSCTNARDGGQTPSGSGTTFNVTPVAGDDLTCTFTNAVRPRVTIRKTSVGGTGSFTFSGSNGIASQTIATTTAGTPAAGAAQPLTAAGVQTTITEGAPPTGFALTDIACTGVPAGSTTVNLATRTVTLSTAATAAGTNATCTFTNTRPTQLTLIKTVTNDNGGTQPATAWTLSAAGPTAISGATGAAAVTNATVNPGTYTLTESTTPTGYTASSYSCVKNGGSAVSGNSITLVAGDTATCTINNNDRPATLTLVKTVTNDNGGTQLPTAWTLSAAGPTNISGATGSTAVTNATVNPGTYTLSESATPTGYTASSYSCVKNGGSAVAGNSITLVAGDVATCTINNNDRPATLTLIKTVTNDNGGTQLPTAWTLSAAGPTNISGATGSTAVTNAAVNPGTYTLSESATPTGYTASGYSCVKNGGAAVVGNSIALVAGDVATCTINNNDSDQTDVSITKVASADTVVRGDEVVFTLVVRNPGVAAAPGTVVRDPAVAGLDCTAAGLAVPTCSATGGASCPTPLTATGLQAGVAIPALPAGSTVSIDLTCRATASGMP